MHYVAEVNVHSCDIMSMTMADLTFCTFKGFLNALSS